MALVPRTISAVLRSQTFGLKKLCGNFPTSQFPAFKFSTTTLCAGRKFTDKHEWVVLDGKVGTVGISQYAQDSLGDIVYAQLPDVGTEFNIMDECGALESVKAASELYCPLTGKVTDKNTEVENTPALINQSCYDKGWLFKMELTKPEELDGLMDEAAYDKFLKAQQDEAEAENK